MCFFSRSGADVLIFCFSLIPRIRQNYEYHDNHNVPRSGMFEHYKTSASLCNLPVVNAATFGKLIRHVFPNITTRRLGTRGMSKYHYCGIRRKPSVTGFMQTTPAYLAR